MKRVICRDLYERIETLERTIEELEEEIIELKAQVRAKTEQATSLAIENQNLRYRLERLKKTHETMVELLKKMKFPVILTDGEE